MAQALVYDPATDDRLSWDKKTQIFSGEISSFRNEDLERLPHEIDITVKASGNTKRFYANRKRLYGRGEDAEVAAWVYRTTDGIELHLIND